MFSKTYQRRKLGKPNFSSLNSEYSVIGVSPAVKVDEPEIRGEAAMKVDEPEIRGEAQTQTYQRKKLRKPNFKLRIPNFSSSKWKDSVIGVSPALKVDESEKRGEAQTQSSENPSHSVPQSPPQKKTRDLPNLTECHSCGFKVDVCSGKNGLRTLYSEWRVVLLCYKCFSAVKSSKICSYCFSGTNTESFICKKCRHSVHRSCFFNYKNVAPWSYSCLGSEFSVCVDCWIPKSMELSRRRLRIRKIKSGMVEKKGRVVVDKGASRVLRGENLVRSMENVTIDANGVAEKVEAAARARDAAIKKAAVARKAVNLETNALSLVANREDEGSLNLPPKLDPVSVVGGLELTSDLHPHLNSSIRNSKDCCLLNRSYLACCVDSSCKTSNSRNASGCDDKDKVSNEDKVNEDSRKSFCKPSVSIESLDTGSSTGLNRLGRSDMKTNPKDGECTAKFDILEIGEELLKEGEGSCSDRLINFNGEDGGLELDRKQADSILHGVERHRQRPDCYFLLKFSRRKCLKPNL